MSEQEKKQRIYDLLNAETKTKKFRNNWSLFMASIQPFNYVTCIFLENKKNATSHPNIGSVMTSIKEERNKMSKEFILKTCNSFRRLVNTMNEKKWWLFYCFVSIFLFCCLFSKLKLILL